MGGAPLGCHWGGDTWGQTALFEQQPHGPGVAARGGNPLGASHASASWASAWGPSSVFGIALPMVK